MNSWILFALIAQLIWAFCSLIDKIVISKGHIKNPLVFILLNGMMNVLLIFILPFTGFEILSFSGIVAALFSGAMLSAAVAVYYKAVQYDEISRIKIMLQTEPVLVLIFSFIFLGEVLTKYQLVGFVCMILAGLVVSYKRSEKSFKLSRAFYLMLISILFGVIQVISAKYVYGITSFWTAFIWLRISGFAALFVLFLPSVRKDALRTLKEMSPKIKKLMIFKMAIDFSAFVFGGYALLKGPVSLVVGLEDAVAPLFTFAFALFFSLNMPYILKENIDRKAILAKSAAIAMIIAGVFFINS